MLEIQVIFQVSYAIWLSLLRLLVFGYLQLIDHVFDSNFYFWSLNQLQFQIVSTDVTSITAKLLYASQSVVQFITAYFFLS